MKTHYKKSQHKLGFTLVITLSMMVLLAMIAIGLLSLSSVEIRASSKSSAMAQAKANARMALMQAIGQLQVTMGPDGRISVPAAQKTELSSTHARWTGVYDAWNAANGHINRPNPTFQQWLVPLPLNQAGNLSFVDSIQPNEVMLLSDVSRRNGGDSVAEVRAPSVAVTTASNFGRCAWWSSDESQKAHVTSGNVRPDFANLADHLLSPNSAQTVNTTSLASLGQIALNDPTRGALITEGQLSLRNAAATSLFHDVSVSSLGLPVDVTRGRFKYDYSLFSQSSRRSVENLPLYKANGGVNDFTVRNGQLINDSQHTQAASNMLGNFGNATEQPGINMEELWIYSNLYRNLRWTSAGPELLAMSGAENSGATDFRRRALSDPWYSYSKPVFASVQFIFSFSAQPEPQSAGKFRMLLQMDALVKMWNPNNVRVVIPPGASYAVQLLSVPFKVQWNITNAEGNSVPLPAQSGAGSNTYALNRGGWQTSNNNFGHRTFQWLRGNVGGLAQSGTSTGYTLEPGECKIFGHDRSQTYANVASTNPNVNLSPGWGPGRQSLIDANFGARNLNPTDRIEFIVTPDKDSYGSGTTRTYCNQWIGIRAAGSQASGGNGGLAIGSTAVPGSIDFTNPDPLYFPSCRSTQRLTVQDYVGSPKPFMIFGHYLNAEQSSSTTMDAFPSVPNLMSNYSILSRIFRGTSATINHPTQIFWRADPLPLSYDSPLLDINRKDQGRFGGGHTIERGVTSVASRQLDVAPTLSLMSLSHAIANGFADRYAQTAERISKGLDGLQSDGLNGNEKFQSSDIAFSAVSYAAPQIQRAIGNSFASPFVAPNAVTGSGPFHSAESTNVPSFDHSYLTNAALFDSWFCSSIHDGAKIPAGAPFADRRGIVNVLTDFFEKSRMEKNSRLMNPRIVPAGNPNDALTRLKSGSGLNADAMSLLGAYVYLDGAFNVNSTSVKAWTALLSSARDLERRNSSGQIFANAQKTPVGVSGIVTTGAAAPLNSTTEIQQWSGFRALSDSEIQNLAEQIVVQVKTRGPFLSLADFLNRRVSGTGDTQLMGAVQAAIESTSLNQNLKQGTRSISAANLAGLPGSAVGSARGGLSRAVGIPGYIMQSDVLASVANQLTVRGDTFRIRAYGSATDSQGNILAEAWCEALIQRTSSYVDPSDQLTVARTSLTSPLNRLFGRRFEIRRFQWLKREEV